MPEIDKLILKDVEAALEAALEVCLESEAFGSSGAYVARKKVELALDEITKVKDTDHA